LVKIVFLNINYPGFDIILLFFTSTNIIKAGRIAIPCYLFINISLHLMLKGMQEFTLLYVWRNLQEVGSQTISKLIRSSSKTT
jgi:hypothetical protein